MADCGATGSAIDRSAQIFTSALSAGIGGGSNAANEATAKASKAIGSFLGNAAVPTSAAGVAVVAPPPSATTGVLMPLAPATSMMPSSQSNQLGLMNHNNIVAHQQQHPDANVNHMMNIGTANSMQPNPLMMQQMNVQQHHHHQQQQQYQMRMHANATHMHMQMNMMNQQMAMMQMSQQMHQQQLQQQQQQQQQQVQQQQQQQDEILEQHSATNVQQQNDINQWHDHLEDEFESYFKTYQQQIAEDDDGVTSTANIGHEGNVEGTSFEKLAEAWAEAEREILDDTTDDINYDPSSLYDENEYIPDTKYEFNPLSESYGQLPQDQQIQSQSQNNSNQEYRDLMAEGMKHFNDGNTKEAILCFESQLQNVDSDNSEAWLMLGKCNAENDQDRKAISCLENAVQRDPYCSEALLNLGVSYVNELNYEQALKHLSNWVTHNPSLDVMVNDNSEMNGLEKVKTLLNQAKEYSEVNDEDSFVDVLEALGVVYNVSREYDDAAKCFETAASRRPGDYQLWNKLGATLANNKQSGEAQRAYNKALSIKPKYARAWLNLAISHSNLQNHEEAARCYLQTISLNPGAVHVWSYLRIALTCSEKWDLLPLAASQNLSAFRDHYDFVQY